MLFLREIYLIALNSFREAVRDKIPYIVLVIAVALALFSILLGEWSVFDREFVVKSVTVSIISISGLFVTMFAGIGQMQKEIQRRTIHTILVKPVSRTAFLLGKYLGLLSLIFMHVFLLSLTLFAVLWFIDGTINTPIVQACYLVFWELAILLALAILFSTFSSAILSSLFVFGFYLIGHLSNQLLEQVYFSYRASEEGAFLREHGELIYNAAKGIQWFFPELYKFNAAGYAAHSIALESSYLVWNSIYATGWVVVILALSTLWFNRKDFV